MAGGVTIVANIADRASPSFQRLAAAVQRPDVRKVMGRAIVGTLRKHFTRLDAERPNKLGGARTHFYGQVRRSVQQPELAGGDGVKVSINHVGIAQRYFGGEIVPKAAKWLTLPVHPEAYGHRAREFSDLDFVPLEGRRAMLVRSNPESPTNIGEVFFLLVKRVIQRADPTVLPSDEQVTADAVNAGEDYINLLIARTQS
jgi:hypothetical protein